MKLFPSYPLVLWKYGPQKQTLPDSMEVKIAAFDRTF